MRCYVSPAWYIGCASASPAPTHFLTTWRQLSTSSAVSPPTHARWHCHWCGLPSACSTARACLSRVAPRAWALPWPLEVAWRAGEVSACDGLQPRTPYARLCSLETSPVTPQRVQPCRGAEPTVIVASAAPFHLQTPADVEWPCVLSDRRRDTSLHIQRTSSCRKLVSCGGARAYMRDAHARKRLF